MCLKRVIGTEEFIFRSRKHNKEKNLFSINIYVLLCELSKEKCNVCKMTTKPEQSVIVFHQNYESDWPSLPTQKSSTSIQIKDGNISVTVKQT
jgi:hypothetical protein